VTAQICTPNQLRVSQITETGGEFLYGFGYFDLRTPNGVPIRAYVGKRRDPFELIAINSVDPKGLASFHKKPPLGLSEAKRIPSFNDYIPNPPRGSVLLSAANDVRNSLGILLQPWRNTRRGQPARGNVFKRLAILTNDTEADGERLKKGPRGNVEFVGAIPGINTKVAAFRDPEDNPFVLVDYFDFEGELVGTGSGP